MDGTTTPSAPGGSNDPNGSLVIPMGKGITHTLIQREQGPAWLTCEWYESKTYQRRLAVSDGQNLTQWILERFGSGKYRLGYYRGNKSGAYSTVIELADPAYPQQPHRIGGPVVELPPAPTGPAYPPAPAQAAAYGPPTLNGAKPPWLEAIELQERLRASERAEQRERLREQRQDEDDRRARLAQEDEQRRKREAEEYERRETTRAREAAAALAAMEKRHQLDLEQMKMTHAFKLEQIRAEAEREDKEDPDSVVDKLIAMEERLVERFETKQKPPSELAQIFQAVQPHVGTLVQVLQQAGQAYARRQAAPPPPQPWAPPPGWTPPQEGGSR